MSKHYQNGYLRCAQRKSGQCWEFLWRENNDDGKRVRRIAIVGTVQQFPTEQLAGPLQMGLTCLSAHDLMDHAVENAFNYLGRHTDCSDKKLALRIKSVIKCCAQQQSAKKS